MAHWGGVSVEGEIGVLGSLESGGGEQEDGHGVEGAISHDQLLTDPEEAVQFVKDTHVDALAVAMGTSHGAYKFSRKPDGAVLAMNVIEEIHRRLPNTHLVMHGSSSVPEDLQEIINKYGGQMKPTWGVPVEEIQRGIKHGVRKINIDTDNRMALTGAIRKVLTENPSEFDPRKYLTPAMAAMRKLCKERFEQFGTAGNAPKIKPLPRLGNGQALQIGQPRPEIRLSSADFKSAFIGQEPHRLLPDLYSGLWQKTGPACLDERRPIVDELADHGDDLMVDRLALAKRQFEADLVVAAAAAPHRLQQLFRRDAAVPVVSRGERPMAALVHRACLMWMIGDFLGKASAQA